VHEAIAAEDDAGAKAELTGRSQGAREAQAAIKTPRRRSLRRSDCRRLSAMLGKKSEADVDAAADRTHQVSRAHCRAGKVRLRDGRTGETVQRR
jgi:hypothetical protein